LTKSYSFNKLKKIKAMKRRVVILDIYREFLWVRGSGGRFNETRLGAAYGSYFK